MKKLIVLSILASTQPAFADPVTLSLPAGATLTFDAPEMVTLKEETSGDNYQYVGSSYGKADPRFNLSIFVEPISCPAGRKLKDVAKCFENLNSRNPAIVADSASTTCNEKSCVVSYKTLHTVGTREIELGHTNTLMVLGKLWLDVHFSITKPTPEDAAGMTKFTQSLVLTPKAN